jgi:Leu/Phe-tRNA-protein transferase
MIIRLPQLHDGVVEAFPDPRTALEQPNGLLAFGGDLSANRLLDAYRHGIFPWFNEGRRIRAACFAQKCRMSAAVRVECWPVVTGR